MDHVWWFLDRLRQILERLLHLRDSLANHVAGRRAGIHIGSIDHQNHAVDTKQFFKHFPPHGRIDKCLTQLPQLFGCCGRIRREALSKDERLFFGAHGDDRWKVLNGSRIFQGRMIGFR